MDDDLFDLKSDNEEWKKLLYGDLFDNTHSKNEKDRDLKIECLIDVMDDDFFPLLPTSDSTLPEESSEITTLLSSPFKNKDKVFNPGILVYGITHFITNEVTQEKNLKEKTSSEALLILEERNFLSISSDQELLFHLQLFVTKLCYHFHLKMRTKFSIPGYPFQKEFTLSLWDYLIGHMKLSRSIPYDREDHHACFQSSTHSVSDHLHVYI
ncbi:hypothetical protein Tco_1282283 [Tanacetum coccineum]